MTGNLKHSNLMGTATASFTSEGDLVISFVSEFSRPYPPHIRTHKAPIPIRTEYYIPPISELSSPPISERTKLRSPSEPNFYIPPISEFTSPSYPNAQSSDPHQNRIFTYPPYPNLHPPHIRIFLLFLLYIRRLPNKSGIGVSAALSLVDGRWQLQWTPAVQSAVVR